MAIQFNCPHCSAGIQVPDASAGKVGRCPKCETRLRIPSITPPQQAAPPAPQPAAAPQADAGTSPPLMVTPKAGRMPLLDSSAVFVMPPQEPLIAPPAHSERPAPLQFDLPPAAPRPQAASPGGAEAAKAEFAEGQENLNRPYVPGTGWPAADRAVQHFSAAARLDPGNADYAIHAGRACQASLQRFLESWESGPLVMIAAFQCECPLGREIDRQEEIFRPTKLTPENLQMLLGRANEALEWYQRALEIDPRDAIARGHRAELLCNVGAFGLALADARQVLESPLVPTSTREQAQQVADFILSEDSPLRAYLTRSEAQQQPPPAGLKLPSSSPTPTAASTLPKPDVAPHSAALQSPGWNLPPTDEFPHIHPDGGSAARPVSGDLPPTAAEFPFVVAATPGPSTASVTARLKQKRSGNWAKVAIPIVCGVILIAIGVGYMIATRPTFQAELLGEDVGGVTLRKTFYEKQFTLPHDRFERMISDFRDEPRNLPTQFRVVQLTGKPQGLEVSLRASEGGRLVRVDLRSHPYLAEFVRQHAAEFESRHAAAVTAALTSFGKDYDTSRSAGMQMGNMGSYLDSLGGDLLVGGLGYQLVARVDDQYFPCCYEDDNGWLYFLVPKTATTFRVERREFGAQENQFPTPVEYQVTIQGPVTAPAATPGPAQAPTEASEVAS